MKSAVCIAQRGESEPVMLSKPAGKSSAWNVGNGICFGIVCQDRELLWSVSGYLEGISMRTCCAFGSSAKRHKLKSLWGHLNSMQGIPLHGCTSPKGRAAPWPGELLIKSQLFGKLQCHLPGSELFVNKALLWQRGQVRTLTWGF